jgi:hypothetical protein
VGLLYNDQLLDAFGALLTAAENDSLAIGAQTLFDARKCPKKLIKFTAAAEGAAHHCEMMNRSLVNRTVLDWLDETLGPHS